ncbi:hypothetical protein N0V91_004941 [Didymella pomorum]|uniref:Uncharacterized protein n=1 Tax=Didymella pomorum TaxID=749634 RepID=A0A9W8ZHJ3_9PLEO|nr:hypothetical protein N0V91_004941 [Didymella pomorum]
MTLLLEATTAQAPRNEEVENKDPFVTTPPREAKSQSSKPATPSNKANTPLHKRFLQEVNMGPDTASTPPRTPSRSPTRNKIASKQTLEVGQNGFYFSMEIPERKIVASRPASRAATPEVKTGRVTPSPEKISGRLTPGRVTPGRLSPSPKKDTKSEMKGTPSGGGKVRDILRKNLFGTPTKKVTNSRWGDVDKKMSPSKDGRYRSQTSDEDMFKVQESLKRSLGQEAFEKAASRPTTPISPAAAASKRATAVPDHSTNPSKLAARPLSMISALEPNAHSVPRKPLTTATRKPRPKSMIVGSAKVLETLASQIDSPRERAKLRSIGAIVPTQQSKFAVSRPSDAPWTSRGSTQATTTRKPVGAQPTVRTTRSAAPSSNSQPKRAALPTPTAAPRSSKQRVVSAEVIADRVAAWNKEDSRPPALKPAPKLPVRSKSVKTLSKRTVKPAPAARPASGRVCTPEPKDTNNDSGTAESFTPPGLPTQLPMSPSKKLLVAPTTPAPTSKDARKQRLQNAHRRPQPPSVAAQLRTPHPVATPATTMVNKRHTWVEGFDEEDHNRYRTPSKEVQSRLDEAIDRKIQEDRMRAGWI